MRYIVRAIKYFFYICVLLSLILYILNLLGLISSDIDTIFTQGWKSVGNIALMFAAIAAFYPLFGYGKKSARIPGEFSEIRGKIVSTMENRGYRLEKEEGENLTFRLRSPVARFFRTYEDRVTMTRDISGYELEGSRKDIVRLAYGLEHAFREEA